MTDHEWQMYQSICESYDDISFKGTDLFVDLFETDDNGIIMFLKPPSKRSTTLEAYLFMVSIFQHQHTRIMYSQVDDMAKQIKDKLSEMDKKIAELENKYSR